MEHVLGYLIINAGTAECRCSCLNCLQIDGVWLCVIDIHVRLCFHWLMCFHVIAGGAVGLRSMRRLP